MQKKIKKIEARLKNLEKLSEKLAYSIASSVRNEITFAFEKEASPFGGGWAALSVRTKERKKSTLKLYESGALRSKWSMSQNGGEVIITSQARARGFAYGAVHQYGSSKRKIPARPFVPIKNGEIPPRLKNIIKKTYKEILKDF